MQIYRDLDRFFKSRNKFRAHCRIDKTSHILDRDHVGASLFKFNCLVYKIIDREKVVGQFFAAEHSFDLVFRREFRIDRVADAAVGHSAVFLDVFYRRAHVIDIVQSIEDTHDVDTRLYRVAVETFDNVFRIRIVAEKVPSSRKRRKFARLSYSSFDLFKSSPRIFTEVAHN